VDVREVLGPGAALSRVFPGYEHRPPQLAMAEAVQRALEVDRPLFVEAGTGTGKTLAYLVPAILSGRKVVVSTATRALQEQIFTRDLPLVTEVLAPYGIPVRAALMKGLSNYLCLRRYDELRQTGAPGASKRWLPVLEAWARTTETGERAELSGLPEDAPGAAELWREVQSSTDTRIGAECTHFEECWITRMRREAEAAQIVVVNHHLFLADLALRTGRGEGYASAIPAYDAVVFDEAHQLEDIATDFFGVRLSTTRIDALVRDATRSLVAAGLLDPARGAGVGRGLLDALSDASRAFFGAFVNAGGSGPSAEVRRLLVAEDFTEAALCAHGKLDAALSALQHYAETHDEQEAVLLVGRRARDARTDLARIVDGARRAARGEADGGSDDGADAGDEGPSVAWLDVRERSASLGSSPVNVAAALRQRLFGRVACVVCTSATLATSGGTGEPTLRYARARLGAPPDTEELVVPSSFDFARRALFYVPRDLPEPSDPLFELAAIHRIEELCAITEGGAFVLCTSNRAMRGFHASLLRRLPYPTMMQGQAPKHLLLSRFRSTGNAVLVATMSFWEGVDVPGRALRLVILDKIPFAVPTDPVYRARASAIDRAGGSAFAELAVPQAALTLKQGFGRLIRTQSDAGVVALLDRRAATKGYGRPLLASLPPAQRVLSLDEVRERWRTMAAPEPERPAGISDAKSNAQTLLALGDGA
jgi:ATP-dependent DNA helicase DinG